jgi:ABC-type transport system involved in multi-copper enzyme maturation permease subunit
MNALVRKEIRLVLPAWIAAMVLAIFPGWLVWTGGHGLMLESQGVAVYAPFGIGVLLLGLAPFAQELNFGTFSILLAQPVSRRRVWLVKTSVVATALSLVFITFCFSNQIRMESLIATLKVTDWRDFFNHPATQTEMVKIIAATRSGMLHQSLLTGGLWTLAAFASGLWTNLLFRNTSAAFWFSLLVPLGLGLLADKLFGGLFSGMGLGDAGLIATLGIYSLTGFLWARKFFLRVQDTQWTGGLLALPALFGSKTDSPAQTFVRNRKPFRALLRKEFQLHQINLIIAGLLLVTHVIVIAVRRFSVDYFMTHRSAAMIWESWPLLWLVMPLLIGGVAVAEERKLGTLENFLCLPTTRRREFAVKFLMAMLLGVFLGGIMPLATEWLGTLAGLSGNVFDASMRLNGKTVSLVSELLFGSAGLTFLALYASTLTRNLLQALGLAVVLSVIASFIFSVVNLTASGFYHRYDHTNNGIYFWSEPLFNLIGWPVMIATVVALAFKNFKQLAVGAKIWSRNVLTILTALVLTAVVTSVIYHRAWEMWMLEEPTHGFAVLMPIVHTRSDLTNHFIEPKMQASLDRTAVILPDGKFWMRRGRIQIVERRTEDGHKYGEALAAGPWREGFVGGSNWREVATSDTACFAIQADGSLWDLSNIEPGQTGSDSAPERFGENGGWKNISSGGEHFLALKSDGTIWEWGDKFINSGKNDSREKIPVPVQIGHASDWVAVGDSRETSVAAKMDGSIWRIRRVEQVKTNGSWISETSEQPRKWFSFPDQRLPMSLSVGWHGVAAICDDGTLWIGGPIFLPYGLMDAETSRRVTQDMVQLGHESQWRRANFVDWESLAALTANGELWEWDRHPNRMGPANRMIIPILRSRYSDWVAACPHSNGSFLALSADGKVCLWSNSYDNEYFRFNGPDPSRLLMPSRIIARTIAEIHK